MAQVLQKIILPIDLVISKKGIALLPQRGGGRFLTSTWWWQVPNLNVVVAGP